MKNVHTINFYGKTFTVEHSPSLREDARDAKDFLTLVIRAHKWIEELDKLQSCDYYTEIVSTADRVGDFVTTETLLKMIKEFLPDLHNYEEIKQAMDKDSLFFGMFEAQVREHQRMNILNRPRFNKMEERFTRYEDDEYPINSKRTEFRTERELLADYA